MKQGLAYLFLGLVAYVVFLVVKLPAQQLYGRLAPALESRLPLQLHQLEGPWWDGRARQVVWDRRSFEDLRWRLHAPDLLRGRLAFRLDLALPPIEEMGGENGSGAGGATPAPRVQVVAALAPDGTLYLYDGRTRVGLALLDRLFNPAPLGLRGGLRLELQHLVWAGGTIPTGSDGGQTGTPAGGGPSKGRLVELEATVRLEGVGLGPPVDVQLGDFLATFSTAREGEGLVEGKIEDQGGPLQVQGLVRIRPDGSYRLTAELAARDPQQRAIVQALKLLGNPSPAGKVSVVRTGRLAFFGR